MSRARQKVATPQAQAIRLQRAHVSIFSERPLMKSNDNPGIVSVSFSVMIAMVLLIAGVQSSLSSAAAAEGGGKRANAGPAGVKVNDNVLPHGEPGLVTGEALVVKVGDPIEMGRHDKYPGGIWGYTGGYDPNAVYLWTKMHAERVRLGRGLYKGAIAKLKSGHLLVNPAAKKTRQDDYIQQIFRSSDGGRSWTLVNDKGPRGKESTLVALRDGAVLLISEDKQFLPEGTVHSMPLWRSEDEGETWTPCEIDTEGLSTTRALLEEDDGSLSLFASTGDWYREDAPASRAYLFRSYDGGRTWKERIDVPSWQRPEQFFCEAHVLRRPDGRLLSASRYPGTVPRKDGPPPYKPVPRGDEVDNHIRLRESLDGGRTWSEDWDVLHYSCVHPYMLNLPDGRILMTYSAYHLPFGVFAVISDDEGRTFDTEHPIQLAVSRDVFTGWASSVILDDGTIVTVHALRPYIEVDDPKQGLWSDLCFDVVRWRLPD